MTPDATGSAVPPTTTADPIPVPAGWVLRYDEQGHPAMVRAEDAPQWEHDHGIVAEPYDLSAAYARFSASHAAIAPAVSQAMEEFTRLGFVRDAMYSALNTALGTFVDDYRWLFTVIGHSMPREAEVRDYAAHLADGTAPTLHPSIAARVGALVDRLV